MTSTSKECNHEYEDYQGRETCKHCGLMRSTIESTTPSTPKVADSRPLKWKEEFDKKFKVYQSAFEQYGQVTQNLGVIPTTGKNIIDFPVAEVKSFIQGLLQQQNVQHAAEIAAYKSSQEMMITSHKADLKQQKEEIVQFINQNQDCGACNLDIELKKFLEELKT